MLTIMKRLGAAAAAASCLGLGACATERLLPAMMMPTPPAECEKILGFQVDPLPSGKTTDAQLAVWMAKEGTVRQQEHAIARVCAEHTLRTAGVMKEKEAPAEAQKGVVAARTTVPSKAKPIESNGLSGGS